MFTVISTDHNDHFSYSFYNTKSVMLCIGITATVLLCVTIFSFQSKVSN